MNLKNILDSLISRKPKRASLPLQPTQPVNPSALVWENPPEAKETPDQRTPAEKLRAVVKIQADFWNACTSDDKELVEKMQQLCARVLEVTEPAKETPRKRLPYIPTDESPWCVIEHKSGKWRIATHDLYDTREFARNVAKARAGYFPYKLRVVRAIIPTR